MKYQLEKMNWKIKKEKKQNQLIKEKFKLTDKNKIDVSPLTSENEKKVKSASPWKTVDIGNKHLWKITQIEGGNNRLNTFMPPKEPRSASRVHSKISKSKIIEEEKCSDSSDSLLKSSLSSPSSIKQKSLQNPKKTLKTQNS